ncbi:hypothetical protein ACFWRV_22535 [Streptomyces sp. NPDC058576]|uniref:hypothetical protein n=1 Tax=Streptomyces sp. NPDC058576 TaxID=3346547 RepID=UPI0036536B3C
MVGHDLAAAVIALDEQHQRELVGHRGEIARRHAQRGEDHPSSSKAPTPVAKRSSSRASPRSPRSAP